MILAMRTDKPEAELYLYDGDKLAAEIKWQAHRELAETLNTKIEELFEKANKLAPYQNLSGAVGNRIAEPQAFGAGSSISYKDLTGIAVFKGPGSFTGLRIGMSAANALAYSLDIPIVATGGEDWIEKSVQAIQAGQNDKVATPEYGSPAYTTKQRK